MVKNRPDNVLLPEISLCPAASRPAHGLAHPVLAAKRNHGAGQGPGIPGRNQNSGFSLHDGVRQAIDSGSDAGNTTGRCLNNYGAESLAMAG